MPDRPIAADTLDADAVRPLTKGPAHHFVGAGDRPPRSPSGRYLLGIEVSEGVRGPPAEAVVGVVDLEGGDVWRPLASTRAWNWHHGAMAQWVPGRADVLLFNTIRDGGIGSLLVDLKADSRRPLSDPVYCLSPSGAKAYFVDFGRLQFYRPGYGYEGLRDAEPPPATPNDDGIWSLDLARGNRRLIVSYADLHEWIATGPSGIRGTWVDGLRVDPEGTRLGFRHHTLFEGGGVHTHLITCSMSGGQLYCVTKGFVGDFAWGPGGTMAVWCGPKSGAGSVRRGTTGLLGRLLGIYGTPRGPDWFRQQVVDPCCRSVLGHRYRVFRDEEGEIVIPAEDSPLSAGHPEYAPDGRWILTETGPDAHHLKSVCLLHPPTGRVGVVAQFGSPPALGAGIRCELCPRWQPDGKAAILDSCHEGRRQIYEMKIPDSALDPSRPPVDPLDSVLAE